MREGVIEISEGLIDERDQTREGEAWGREEEYGVPPATSLLPLPIAIVSLLLQLRSPQHPPLIPPHNNDNLRGNILYQKEEEGLEEK